MITACYSMDLYCDIKTSLFEHDNIQYGSCVLQLTGNTFTDCAKQARKLGWKLNRKSRKVLCPECVNNGFTFKSIKES
jgi:hypothetical protein